MSRALDAASRCPSCGNLTEERNGFCGNCGADLTGLRPAAILSGGAANGHPVSPPKAEPVQPLKNVTRSSSKPYEGSAFKKTINDDLSETFSSLDPAETPWFGLDFGIDLLAVTPYRILVTGIVDPSPIENATIYKSLFPEGPWLLTTADGTDLPLDNPLVNVTRAMRSFEDRLAAFFTREKKTGQNIRVEGLIVFPDGYDLRNANEPHTLAEGSAGVRVINAGELAQEMLKPAQQARLNPELWREWLCTFVLPSHDDDSIALTWLDPKGDTISKRVQTFSAQRPVDAHRSSPPGSSRVFSHAILEPLPRKTNKRLTILVLGLSAVMVLSSLVLWDVYGRNRRGSQNFVQDRVLGTNIPAAEPPRQMDPQRRGAPADGGSNTTEKSNPSSNGNRRAESKIADNDAWPVEKSSPDSNPPASAAALQKTIEDQIGRAIHQRAVDGVFVAFVDDTAYLTGAVFSEKQKAAAEEAARNVPGVKRVQNSISVKWETG